MRPAGNPDELPRLTGHMNALRFALLVFSALGCGASRQATPAAATDSATAAAEHVAAAWLPLIDWGRDAESWNAAASLFRSKVSTAQWRGLRQSS